ncbi:hypothetical protein D3C87_1682200 [compost metagenome]
MDDIGSIDKTERLTHVVIGYQYANAACRQVSDKILDIRYGNWIDTCKRFVEQHERRVCRQCPGNFQAASFAAR